VVLSAAVGIPALAQDYQEFHKKCFENGSPDQTIEACSVVITGGLVGRKDLATAFKNRGNAFDDKGQYDRSLQDYEHALAINPKDADAFNNRGTYLSRQGGVAPVRSDTRRVENKRRCIPAVSGSPAANADARCCNPPSTERSEQAPLQHPGLSLPGHSRA